jgi:hypothetical protein
MFCMALKIRICTEEAGRPTKFLKGLCHEIFDTWFFSSNNSSWDTDPRVEPFFNIDSYSPRNSTLKSPILWSAVSMTLLTKRFFRTSSPTAQLCKFCKKKL